MSKLIISIAIVCSGFLNAKDFLSNPSESETYVNNLGINKLVQQRFYKDTLIPSRTKANEGIVVLAKAYNDSIVLRFAPPDYAFWVRAQKSGFVVKRGKDSTSLKQIAIVFPIPLKQIDTSNFSKDSFSLMATGLLYGNVDRSQIQGYMKDYRANQQILDMSLLVSEFSANAAHILGFRYVDKDVRPGETYYYEVSNPVYENKKYKAKTKIKNEYKSIRAPYQFNISTGDEQLTLRWSKDYNGRAFTYYMIERSDDNKNFYPITERPLVFYQSELSKGIPDFSYIDSLNLINDTKYYYRLLGGNSFGEFSPAALADGTPKDLTPPSPPKITNASYDYKSQLFNIEWENDFDNLSADFSYAQLMVARNEKGPYAALSEKLGPTDFNYIYNLGTDVTEEMEGPYFFRIECYDQSGNKSFSEFESAFVPDFTNPAVPDTLIGSIDSLSFVNIQWPKSSSKDVRGYWLYWANSPDAEFSLVSQTILTDTTYKYYIEEKSLTKNIYYTLRAEDYAYNRSDAAIVLKLKRRDVVPPITPMIKAAYTDSLKLKLNIIPSGSDDVRINQLFRRDIDSKDTTWTLLDSFPSMSIYSDHKAVLNTHYEYKMRAIDSTGNISTFSVIKGGILKATSQNLEIKDFKIRQTKNSNEVELSWNFNPPKELKDKKYKFIISRSTGQDGVKYYQELNAEMNSYKDSKLNGGVLYNYAVSVKYEDGLSSLNRDIKSLLIQ
ncbi:MAG: hypothetical protein IPK88_18980 [Saprospiraceae bacterium]|nr:hypothetical protein [Candidatus Defluviibacterium haderslevense]